MTPEQFIQRIQKGPPAPAYLFLGQEGYGRRLCKEALLKKVLPNGPEEEGLSRFDLENTSLSEVLDDARSLSLFASDRVIWVSSAELALPRRLSSGGDDEEGRDGRKGSDLTEYLKRPSIGIVLVLECSRYDFSGDDRARIERVQKYYSGVSATVEFRHYTPESIRSLAQQMAREHNLKISGAELPILLDAVAGDVNRLASEMEKLALYVEDGRPVTGDDLRALVPDAAQGNVFLLVNALGKGDRSAALRSLDVLIREGEYLPLALTFLSTQFRLALTAKEAKLNSAGQAQAYFTKIGVRIWRERAEQVIATASSFTRARLAKALALIYVTDKKFREGYRDDRVVMETLVFALTAADR